MISGNVSYVKVLFPASCIKITTDCLLPAVFLTFSISSSFVFAPAESLFTAFQSRYAILFFFNSSLASVFIALYFPPKEPPWKPK